MTPGLMYQIQHIHSHRCEPKMLLLQQEDMGLQLNVVVFVFFCTVARKRHYTAI